MVKKFLIVLLSTSFCLAMDDTGNSGANGKLHGADAQIGSLGNGAVNGHSIKLEAVQQKLPQKKEESVGLAADDEASTSQKSVSGKELYEPSAADERDGKSQDEGAKQKGSTLNPDSSSEPRTDEAKHQQKEQQKDDKPSKDSLHQSGSIYWAVMCGTGLGGLAYFILNDYKKAQAAREKQLAAERAKIARQA